MAVCIHHFYEILGGEDIEDLEEVWDGIIGNVNLITTIEWFDRFDIEDEFGFAIYFCLNLGSQFELEFMESLKVASTSPAKLIKEEGFIDGHQHC